MAKIDGVEYPGLDPVLKVCSRFDPHSPLLCSGGGKVDRGLKLGRDDDPVELGGRERNFALDGPDGMEVDQKLR